MELLNVLTKLPISVYDGNLGNVELTGLTKLVATIIDKFSIGGYIAVGILLFTLLLKIIPLPLDIYSRVATKKNALRMERMRPELEKLQKQYANNKELYQKKMMALYKKEGYSTFASCLPTIFTLVFFILVISAFNQYSAYHKVEVFNQMAISYSQEIRYDDRVSVYECTVDGDGNIVTPNVETATPIAKEDIKEENKHLYVYYVQDEATFNAVMKDAQDAAAEKYFELADNQKFLWVRNIWVEDLPWKKAFVNKQTYNNATFTYTKGCSCKGTTIESSINNDQVYDILTGSSLLDEEKSKPNGFLILVALSIGSMFLSQIVMSKSQKAQLELQSVDQTAAQTNKMMKWMMPIMFGIFSFMYTASFSLYLIVSTLFSMVSTVIINKIVERKFVKRVAREEEEKYNKRYAHILKNKNKDE